MTQVLALDVDNLSYSFGRKQALDRVGFEIKSGECMMLLGPNGAGKTTLFSLITRLYDSGTGSVTIAGYDLKKRTPAALSKLGVVFQQPTLDLDLSVLQNLKYHAALHGIGKKDALKRIQQELERQEMFDRRKEKVRHLNGGHRRRVEIARALLHKPAILLLDEPTVGLDIPSRQGLVKYVHDLCSEKGIAVLWATHLIDEIDRHNQLIVIHHGRVLAKGGLDQVLETVGAKDVESAFKTLTASNSAVGSR